MGESILPLVRGVLEKSFDLRLLLCAFLMHFWMPYGPVFQPSWADLEQAAFSYP